MIMHWDMAYALARQRQSELIADAERGRLARHRRAAHRKTDGAPRWLAQWVARAMPASTRSDRQKTSRPLESGASG